jgi:cell filamentation protein
VTFDPFGDFATEGYLRNFEKEKDIQIVKRLEHSSFATGLDDAFALLAGVRQISYEHVLQTHGVLFSAVYPWAGQDRTQTAPRLSVSKGAVIFANPAEIRAAMEFGLSKGQDRDYMIAKPGEVLGYFAFAHPFLDGNGRTIITVHSVLAQRAGFSIDWSATDKDDYLAALSREIEAPGKGHLDDYLKAFIRGPVAHDRLGVEIMRVPGLDGASGQELNRVLGSTEEPAVRTQYEAMILKRRQS